MATVVGLFDNTNQAETAVRQLRESGVAADDISVAMRAAQGGTTSTTAVDTDTDSGAGGAVTGAIGGGVLGGLAGLLIGIGAVAIPGIGPLAVGGPLGTALIGAGIGAAAGGLVGALVDAGVPEEEARMYETGVQRGGVLVTARVPNGQEAAAQDILNRNGARDVRQDATNLYANPDYRYGQEGTVDTTGTYGTGAETRAVGTGYDRTDIGREGRNRGVGPEAAGGAAGAVAGGVVGGVVGGPVGAGVGAAIGGAVGAGGAAAADEHQAGDTAGSGAGGAAGAVTGAAIGSVAGPVGAAAGAAIGGAAGGASGKAASDAAEDATEGRDLDYDRDDPGRTRRMDTDQGAWADSARAGDLDTTNVETTDAIYNRDYSTGTTTGETGAGTIDSGARWESGDATRGDVYDDQMRGAGRTDLEGGTAYDESNLGRDAGYDQENTDRGTGYRRSDGELY